MNALRTIDYEEKSRKKIRRVTNISRLNGWSILAVAGLSALVSLVLGHVFGVVIGCAVAVSGYFELRGHQRLVARKGGAVAWLVISQWYLMIVLWSYCVINLYHFDSSNPWAMFSPRFKEFILAINPDAYLIESMLTVSYYATYISLILAVFIYQGGLSLYYLSVKKYLYPKPL